jgi:DNA-directed RNA polymerase subunit RPC12/RpoP
MAGEIVCGRCGASFSRISSLKRHRAERRCPGRRALVPAKPSPPRPGAIRAAQPKVLDVAPIRSEIVPATRPQTSMPLGWVPGQPVPYAGMVRIGASRIPAHVLNSFWDTSRAPQPALGVNGRQRLVRRPGEADMVTLWEQFYFLRALAVRLDAGRGTEGDRVMFEAGLREYDTNFERVRAGRQRKVLPG